ncbi:MAG: TetR/AcrR family transcriptional regulator [Spirochaetales bacterium]|nr:TetR/AcrR family transcriptional regulator [Spirochaetales bacterium]
MPKVFTGEQKQAMRKKLIGIGFKIFSEYGIRKSRVEDITRQAGIAKGTFYSFFPSKEALFMAALDTLESESRPLLNQILTDKSTSYKQRLKNTLQIQLKAIEKNPIVKTLFNPEEIAYLTRNIPEQGLSAHIREHNKFYMDFLTEAAKHKQLTTTDIATASALLQTIFFLAIHKSEIGPSFFKQLNLLIELIADGLLTESRFKPRQKE